MGLAGQDKRRKRQPPVDLDARGYVMVVLLIGMAVTAVGMAATLPAWRHQVMREREAELVFRGEAMARAIQLYRQKNNGTLPQSIDVLVQQKYLRKKYKDPITDKDFAPLVAATAPGVGGGRGIMGVRSTSTEASLRVYNQQTTYSQWAFDFTIEQLKQGGGGVTAPPEGIVGDSPGPGPRATGPGVPGGGVLGRPGGPGGR